MIPWRLRWEAWIWGRVWIYKKLWREHWGVVILAGIGVLFLLYLSAAFLLP